MIDGVGPWRVDVLAAHAAAPVGVLRVGELEVPARERATEQRCAPLRNSVWKLRAESKHGGCQRVVDLRVPIARILAELSRDTRRQGIQNGIGSAQVEVRAFLADVCGVDENAPGQLTLNTKAPG